MDSFQLVQSQELHYKPWAWKTPSSSDEEFIRISSAEHILLNPILSFGTIAWRGTKPLTENTTAYWEVWLEGSPYGTSVQCGVGKEGAMTQSYDFIDLLGLDDNSYGLNYRGYAQRSGMKVRVCKPIEGPNPSIGILFDGPNRSLSFFIEGQYLCTPFTDIDLSEALYPFVSSTAQCTSMRLCNQYSKDEVLSLLFLARKKVNDSFDQEFLNDILPRDITR